jgi:hypothetical protein
MVPKKFQAGTRSADTLAHSQKPLLVSLGTIALADSGESGYQAISVNGPGSEPAHARGVLMFLLTTNRGN